MRETVMGEWYIVVKTIKGRKYRYRQRTWREGKQVRTESHSLGPVDPAGPRGSAKTPKPARPTLAALTATVVVQLRDERVAVQDWIKPFRREASNGPIKKLAALEKVIAACSVSFRQTRNGSAFYAYGATTDYIGMPPQRCFFSAGGVDRQEHYYHTLFHELSHWTRHPERTGRVLRTGLIGRDLQKYAREELVAESTAVIVLTQLGYPPTVIGHHANYFRHWLRLAGDESEALAHAKIEAEQAAAFILARVNTTNAECDTIAE